ncbi:hypothetical protein [Caballeronia sp. RCC_10]|uniref:hypothetical protein n=1 Tax=Caballeronia sp. RCC_10 TaxID=3239227 RepID=UPI003525F874
MFLNQVAEWRYDREPTSTPWYPSMRLVRASELGGWDEVVGTLQQLLHADA